MTAKEWHVTRFRGAKDNRVKRVVWSETAMVRTLCRMHVWTGDKGSAPAWSPVKYRDGVETRGNRGVEFVTMLVLDCDAGEPLDTLEAVGDEFCRLGHTSWSHHVDKPKARLVFPLAKPCPADVWPRVWSAAAEWAKSEGVKVDAAAKDPARLYFGPFVPDDITSREHWEAWAYGPDDEPQAGRMPVRARTLMSWAWLLSKWEPEDDPGVFVPPPLAGVGTARPMPEGHEDRMQARREAFAMACVDKRAQNLAVNGVGGRNKALYGAGRMVRGLERAGALRDPGAALEQIARAAVCMNGGDERLTIREAQRSVNNGYRRGHGANDDPFPIEEYVND